MLAFLDFEMPCDGVEEVSGRQRSGNLAGDKEGRILLEKVRKRREKDSSLGALFETGQI